MIVKLPLGSADTSACILLSAILAISAFFDWLVGFIKFLILGQTKEVVENAGLRRGLFQMSGHGSPRLLTPFRQKTVGIVPIGKSAIASTQTRRYWNGFVPIEYLIVHCFVL